MSAGNGTSDLRETAILTIVILKASFEHDHLMGPALPLANKPRPRSKRGSRRCDRLATLQTGPSDVDFTTDMNGQLAMQA